MSYMAEVVSNNSLKTIQTITYGVIYVLKLVRTPFNILQLDGRAF